MSEDLKPIPVAAAKHLDMGKPCTEALAVGFGMTLRDHLAARAMQAALTNWPADAGDWMRERAELAQRAYAMADAMLETRHA